MNEALDDTSGREPVAEVRGLHDDARAHRDGDGHDWCWHHPVPCSLRPKRTDPLRVIADWPPCPRRCLRHRPSIDAPDLE